jgi:dodecin
MTSMVRVIEVIAQSDKGFDDAVRNAVAEAGKTVRDIKSVYVKEMEAMVENDKVTLFRVNAKISFMIERTA